MEDVNLFKYEDAMPDSPASDRLVINMDAANASGGVDACASNGRHSEYVATLDSSSDPLPSLDSFTLSPPIPRASIWTTFPSADNNSLPNMEEGNTDEMALGVAHAEEDDVVAERQYSVDRSFQMDTILGLEQHYYTPRYSTPDKRVCTAPCNTVMIEQPLISTALETCHNTQTPGHSCSFPSVLQSSSTPSSRAHNLLPNHHHAASTCVPIVYKRQINKPPYTYVSMIVVTILNSKQKQLTLAEIREKLQDMFLFFRGEYTGWKNSIRHALSNSKCFYKEETRVDEDTSSVFVWKVNTLYVKPNTFNRQSQGPDFESYAHTLLEELGLPLFSDDNIVLPPKPCFQSAVSLTDCDSDDFLNARNESVPTPHDLESVHSVCSSSNDTKPSRKRKRDCKPCPEMSMTPVSRNFASPSVSMDTAGYGHYLQQMAERFRPHESYNYGETPTRSTGQQWSHDLHRYGNPELPWTGTQPWNFYSYDDLALRQWCFNQCLYHGTVPGSQQPTYYHHPYAGWFPVIDEQPETALSLTKEVRN